MQNAFEKLLSLAVTLSFSTAALADEPVARVDALDIAPVWAGHPVGFALLTHAPFQFVAFYDEHRQMTVAQRRLDERKWTFTKLPQTTGWDSHNYIALAADDGGFLHLSGNMHVVPLIYFRTTKPWDAATFERVEKMVGSEETRCTYPRFLRGATNEFLFCYRDGRSGNGNQIFNIYDCQMKTWNRLLDHPLTDGEGQRNGYFDGPMKGPDGYFHLAWVWRESPDAATCHDLSYARSRDLKHWETGAGKPLPLPIRLGTSTIVDPVPQHGGILNTSVKLGFDNLQRPTISYHKADARDHTQPFIARLESGRWVLHQVTNWPYRWDFGGGGALVVEVSVSGVRAEPGGRLTAAFRHAKFGNGTWLLDPETLRAAGTVQRQELPTRWAKPEGKFPGLKVQWVHDSGESGLAGRSYRLRWETLDANRDRPREGPLPPPSMLRLLTIRTAAGHEPRVAQVSKPPVSRVSKPAGVGCSSALPTWKSAIQQVWKPALRRKGHDLPSFAHGTARTGLNSALCSVMVLRDDQQRTDWIATPDAHN
jgi:hypothetical protein